MFLFRFKLQIYDKTLALMEAASFFFFFKKKKI